MMKEKRKGRLQRGIMVAVSALTVMASAGTVMAYQPVASSDESFEEVIFDDSSIEDFGLNDIDENLDDDLIRSLDFSSKRLCIYRFRWKSNSLSRIRRHLCFMYA